LREGLSRAILLRGVTETIAEELAEKGDAMTEKFVDFEELLRRRLRNDRFLISSHQRKIHGKV